MCLNENQEPHIKTGRHKLEYVCDITPAQNTDGTITEFMPQDRYENVNAIPLNNYGVGPYCKFKIPNNRNYSGVYAILVDGGIRYIGECQSLSSRYNMGYGNISPRNCFVGGQETNCRINNLIFNVAKNGAIVSLWFLQTDDYKEIEQELRRTQMPKWNRS